MDLINKKFENLIDNQYLTENISLLIYSLIRTTRPLKLLEFGAGFSTICIAKAFQDIQKEEFNPNVTPQRWGSFCREIFKEESEDFYREKTYEAYKFCFDENSILTGNKYDPKLITVDNSNNTNVHNSFNKISSVLEKLNLSKYVEFIHSDWMEVIKGLDESNRFDFVWVDLGSGLEYKEIFDIIFPILNPAGIVAFHNVATNVACRYFLAEMKLRSKLSDEFEMMTLWEPHKKTQNSIVLFKKNIDYPIYNLLAL